MIELQRWRERRGLSFNIQPKHWPFDANLADRFVIAINVSGKSPDAFLRHLTYQGAKKRYGEITEQITEPL